MSKILAFLTIFAFMAIVSSLNYDFVVQLAPIKNTDGDLNGTLKVYLHTQNTKDFLRLNQTTLRQGAQYLSHVNYTYSIDKIQNVTFQWTLTSPYPPKFWIRRPSIYLRRILVVPAYIQDPTFRQSETKTFCTANESVGIKHKDTLMLKRC